ncbi:YbaB/EbfC family DNA-binding protein [Actinopolymorpha rutila]|uniref:DNA-binding protein YbaB n=1 Tax=Actinopolymorpha rutila TaxID=446787 RepID=A0A852ZWH0_9ACTN|nr:YbaB/EbfC family DNA-binding protein [Actinopolymorpha rutila]NYH93649.1 DNA-binding protein YbaB [Actinopolymorpha rutila]
MSEDLNLTTATVERLLTDTRQALERMRAPAGPSPSAPEELPRGTGESADGRVHAVVEMPGRVASLEMDPRLMREGSEAVCSAMAEAVNSAMVSLRSSVLSGATAVDPGALAGELERVQEESLVSARSMLATLQDAMDRVGRRA